MSSPDQDVVASLEIEPGELLASGRLDADQLFEAVLTDRDRLLSMILTRDIHIRLLRDMLEASRDRIAELESYHGRRRCVR